MKTRCQWPGSDLLMQEYHDKEWGKKVTEDKLWFEYLVLDAFQAGLSWKIVLHKREGFRNAFCDFDVIKVADLSEEYLLQLKEDASIIRNKLKINATVSNAKAFVKIQQEFGSFNSYMWNFVDGKAIHNHFEKLENIPQKTELSDKISKDLISRGFKFVGSTICYAFMQAAGIVNDHTTDCFRHQELLNQKD